MRCSYLIKERNYLSKECASSDVPIADRIWKSLSSTIETVIMKVNFWVINLESCTVDSLIPNHVCSWKMMFPISPFVLKMNDLLVYATDSYTYRLFLFIMK